MKRKCKLVALLSLTLLLSGCATNYGASQIQDFGRYSSLDKGSTTKQGVYELFGQPHDVTYLDSMESVWTYYSVNIRNNALTYIPFVGLLAGGLDTNASIASFFFDTSQIFQKVQTSTKAQYTNMWVGMATIMADNSEMERVSEEMEKLDLPYDQQLARQMQGTDDILR
jgi:hypothetical protein